ncbi:MAG: isoprenylcysteine carboxylmethyltransferase family protein, partial [Ignavibacteriales bacterium]|nr:isoprenylcysteine carboxylmethyltransferase family protein [Ignavibacteriales bacterium]
MASFKELLFTYRSYTPIPFVVLALVFGRPTSALLLMGVMPALAGEAIRLWGVAYAGSLTRATGNVGAPSVVMAGPYAHVRNPLYIGNILMYVGFGVMSNALVPWLPLVALLFFSWQYRSIVSLEE